MALVLFERNGQGFYDFDELLQVVSVEFISRVQLCIELYEKYGIEFDVKVELSEHTPVVFLVQENRVRVFRYYKGSSVIHEMMFSKEDIEMLGGVFG